MQSKIIFLKPMTNHVEKNKLDLEENQNRGSCSAAQVQFTSGTAMRVRSGNAYKTTAGYCRFATTVTKWFDYSRSGLAFIAVFTQFINYVNSTAGY